MDTGQNSNLTSLVFQTGAPPSKVFQEQNRGMPLPDMELQASLYHLP